MDTSKLKKFAQYARRSLIEQVQSKLKLVLAEDSAARRESPKTIKELENKRRELGDDQQLIEQVAYTWFNRFCALRFMDANQYNRIMVVSPIAGQFQPEILAEAKAGHLDDAVFDAKTSEKIRGLLSGSILSRDGQAEAYRLMIVAVCNDYHRIMPYLFERIEDYTELLMPEDLLSGNSILAYTREAMTPENCESVESIGWLYQFYISEKKDKVFEALKKNKKITPENIPAATQLFTPHWIVRYLVENSLGRLWMLNNPTSKVIEQMEYYIKPVEEETDFLKISTPEELKICDPAAGSGHMLTYAYDLLYAIYLDANYDPVDIPELILTKNLYGIEIDERAAELAAFALSMKAMKGNPFDDSNNRRRFFRNPIKPNICRLEKVTIDQDALEEYIEFAGKELFTAEVRATLKEFEEADNFGSLIKPTLETSLELLEKLELKDTQVDLFLKDTHDAVIKILKQTEYLLCKYHVAVANPPYMGQKGMNPKLASWSKENYPFSKTDLFAMFIERDLNLVLKGGFSAMINMQSWMFLSSFEKLRIKLLNQSCIVAMAHLGSRAFDTIGGEIVSTTAFILKNRKSENSKGQFIRLVNGKSEKDKNNELLRAVKGCEKNTVFFASSKDFNSIPGKAVIYWFTPEVLSVFSNKEEYLSNKYIVREGLNSGDNNRFIRFWPEVSLSKTSIHNNEIETAKWFPHRKGGDYRKWYGNYEFMINWESSGEEIHEFHDLPLDYNGAPMRGKKHYFQNALSWGRISTSNFSVRYDDQQSVFDSAAPSIMGNETNLIYCLGILNSSVAEYLLNSLSPTINYRLGVVGSIPIIESSESISSAIKSNTEFLIDAFRDDWNELEISWDFKRSPLLKHSGNESKIEKCCSNYFEQSLERTEECLFREREINDKVATIYGLRSELTDTLVMPDITLDSNPYRGKNQAANVLEIKRQFETKVVIDFLSYATGCMFGRYSIDVDGIVLANQGDTSVDYFIKMHSPTFQPDRDNVIPIIDFDGDWFEDDISERFKEFLKVTFGEENFAENLSFIERAIGKDIKKYFTKDFYADHYKRYKKRPIYWMFSSPKGKFNALIYMHRYQPDTVSIVLNDYLREFRTKLEARKASYEQIEISASASQKDKTQAIKAIDGINKVLEEVNDYEHDVLYPLAGEKIEIDLDNGVKHNYPLFGKALKKIPGLS